ncbi:heme exporter protein CcmD [Rhodanobacter sp. 7MK24]|uniref:heme exporter protein CcmD n=1 Tax=Rhodanobacter sp. 7MK24 TaxID=2775922 RepID=UPI00178454ED|nr:heme exporter protein CcmD [Rhodanobacter sp. 7MK24]MBD8879465.1 heme exporter protein CcmD [Rhodanobacter sp. 7MK24]
MSTLSHFFALSGEAAAFFRMGGYAGYVWPAYAVFFVVLIADNVAPRLRRRRILRELRGRLARQVARERRSPSSTPAP